MDSRLSAEKPRPTLAVRSAESFWSSVAPQTARFSPPCSNSTIRRPNSQYVAARRAEVEADYGKMQDFFMVRPPAFGELWERLRAVETRINAVR